MATAGRDPQIGYRIRSAMWSVFYHAMFLRGLRDTQLTRPDDPEGLRVFQPLGLDRALDVLLEEPFNEHDTQRRRLALRKLATAGLANARKREALIWSATGDFHGHVIRVLERIDALAGALGVDISALAGVPPEDAGWWLDARFAEDGGLVSCLSANASCVACYDPFDPSRPTTRVTGSVYVNRPLSELAAALDPRSWEKCIPDFFKSSVRSKYLNGTYQPIQNDPDAIGAPWKGTLVEEVEAGPSYFKNALAIDFSVASNEVRAEFSLVESLKFKAPLIDLNEGLNIDKGFTRATPHVPGWCVIEMEKTVQFVDITTNAGSNPFGLDPGEYLNYWAPAILCLWVEYPISLGMCCSP